MAFREVNVLEVREVLRGWLAGAGLRTVAAQAGVDRKTARRYVQAAEAAGVVRDGGWGQVTDEVVGEVVGEVVTAVRPARPAGHGSAWELLAAERQQIVDWVDKGLTVVKIGTLLGRPPSRRRPASWCPVGGSRRRTGECAVSDGVRLTPLGVAHGRLR